MSHWEAAGQSNEWYTPKYIFDALDCHFDMDVANSYHTKGNVPADTYLVKNGLEQEWRGFVWMNPPFGGRNGIIPWLDKFFEHGNGIALTPDRTSAPWWQDAAHKAKGVLFIAGKIKFERPDGTVGVSPSTGTTLFAAGNKAMGPLIEAEYQGLGRLLWP